jgi:SanA protein
MKRFFCVLTRGGLYLASLVLVCVMVILAVDAYVASVGRAGIVALADAQVCDCVIVPGASVVARQPSMILQDRLDVALDFYRSGRTNRILVSGDHGQKNYDEVNVMRKYLLAQGVPAEDIFMDHAGFDTYDTLYRARDIFQVRKALVVTQEFHLLRALYIGKQLGLDLQGVTSDSHVYSRAAYYRLREYFARFKAFLDCQVLHSQPSFLGEAIPISGDGRVTADGN